MDAMEIEISQAGLTRLANDKWLASSLLQKAVRRGDHIWALAAASALFEAAPQRLWRRMATIAVEDIGIAGLTLIGDVVTAHRSRNRGNVEQRRQEALDLITRLCQSPKCRAVDDLLMVGCYGRHLEYERQRFAQLPLEKVAEVAVSSDNPEIAAIAAVYASGSTMRPGFSTFGARRGSPAMLFDGYLFGGHFLTVAEMCRDGFAATGCELFAILPVVTRLWNVETLETITDEFPAHGFHDGVPSCAVDYFTRPGRAALERFLTGSTETARWMREMVGPKHRLHSMGYLLFQVDGGLLRDRLVWPFGLEMREGAAWLGNPGMPDAESALALFRSDFAEFDGMRSDDHV